MTGASDVAPLERSTRIVASRDAVSADLDGETVILGMREGIYYGLERVGSFIWQSLAEPVAMATLHERVVRRYAVESDAAWADLVALVGDLLAAGLVERAADA